MNENLRYMKKYMGSRGIRYCMINHIETNKTVILLDYELCWSSLQLFETFLKVPYYSLEQFIDDDIIITRDEYLTAKLKYA